MVPSYLFVFYWCMHLNIMFDTCVWGRFVDACKWLQCCTIAFVVFVNNIFTCVSHVLKTRNGNMMSLRSLGPVAVFDVLFVVHNIFVLNKKQKYVFTSTGFSNIFHSTFTQWCSARTSALPRSTMSGCAFTCQPFYMQPLQASRTNQFAWHLMWT